MINKNIYIAVGCLICATLTFSGSRGLSFEGALLINASIGILAVLSVIFMMMSLRKPVKSVFFESPNEFRKLVVLFLILSGFVFFLPRLGFLISGYVFYFSFTYYISPERSLKKSIMASFIMVSLFFGAFRFLLDVPLPAGAWLGY